jgi:hypothetical protein
MSIIISKEGKNAERLDRSSITKENYLQEYILDNPKTLPIEDIKEDLRLLILAREFPTGSGPIDALGIDQEGNIYVIETKLYKNPDKRLVIAQALDYGASLQRTYEDDSEFLRRLEEAASKTFRLTLTEKVQSFYEADEETVVTLLQNLRQNLRDGKFRFVILMDRLEDRLRNLIAFVNQNSRFDIFGIELEFYKFQEYEIIIPKLYGAEVKKETGVVKSYTSLRKKWDELSFFEEANKHLNTQMLGGLQQLYDFSKKNARITWGTSLSGSFSTKFDHINSKSLYTVYSNGDLDLNFAWLGDNEKSVVVAEQFGQKLKLIPNFAIPENFREKYVRVTADRWSPQLSAFIKAVQFVTQPNDNSNA